MKATLMIRKAIVLSIVCAMSISSGCKKDRDQEQDTNSLQQLSKDEVSIESATGDVLNDANTVLSGSSSRGINGLPCNVTIDSTNVVNDTITYSLTFNGLNCAGTHLREGNAEIKKNINTYWYQAGTAVILKYINLKITKVVSGKYVILNGSKTFENVTGGLLFQLGNGVTSVTHKITGYVQATFDDNTTRLWNITRQRTFTGSAGQLVVTEDGFGSADGYSNLVVWGTNRNGEAFYSKISQSIVCRQECGWDPASGILIHDIPVDDKAATITFGYDDNNQPVSGSNCPTRYKVDWEKGTNSGTIYLQLP